VDSLAVEYSKHGYWEVRCSKNYAFVCCPIMEQQLSFRTKREIYSELKILELELQMDGREEIVGYTKISNPHIMIMFAKLGYVPFHLSVKKQVLWFKKEF